MSIPRSVMKPLMEASTQKPQRESSGAAVAALLLLVLLFLPILYVLSLGPVIWIVNRTGMEPGIFTVIYAPLEWLHEESKFAKWVLDAYIKLWR
jgi:hypothetical protein